MPDNKYLIQIQGDVRDIKRKLGSLEDRQEQYARETKSSISKASAAFKKYAKVITGVTIAFASAKGLIAVGKKWLELAREQQLAEKQLETALGHTSEALLNHAAARQQDTIYGDEQIIQAQALLAAFIKDEEQLKAATDATLDLAAAKGMDLKAAADLVGKSVGSSTNALSRYGIEVEGNVGSSERLATLVADVSEKFGGQAEAAAENLGVLKQTGNVVGDLGESLGTLLGPAVIYVANEIKELAMVAKAAVDWLNRLLGITKEDADSLEIYAEQLKSFTFQQLQNEAARLEKQIRKLTKAAGDPEEIKRLKQMQQAVFTLLKTISDEAVSLDKDIRSISTGLERISDESLINGLTQAMQVISNARMHLVELPALTQEFEYKLQDLMRDQQGMVNLFKLLGDTASQALMETDSWIKAVERSLKSLFAQMVSNIAIWAGLQFIQGAGGATGNLLQFLGHQLFGFDIKGMAKSSPAITQTAAVKPTTLQLVVDGKVLYEANAKEARRNETRSLD